MEIKLGNGSIIFFNQKKKMGMIKATNNAVYWFHQDAVNLSGVPSEGDIVAFSYQDVKDPMPLMGIDNPAKILTIDIV